LSYNELIKQLAASNSTNSLLHEVTDCGKYHRSCSTQTTSSYAKTAAALLGEIYNGVKPISGNVLSLSYPGGG